MGVHNRITEEKFNRIKPYAKESALDREVAKTFGVGRTTVRNIRLSKDYEAYCKRVFRFHQNLGKKSSPSEDELDLNDLEIFGELELEPFGEPEENTTGEQLSLIALLIVGAVAMFALLGIIGVALNG